MLFLMAEYSEKQLFLLYVGLNINMATTCYHFLPMEELHNFLCFLLHELEHSLFSLISLVILEHEDPWLHLSFHLEVMAVY